MLDIRFIRKNPDLVAEKSKQKGYNVDIKKLLELDEQRRQLLSQIEEKRAEKNELSQSRSISPSPSPADNPPGDVLPPSEDERIKGKKVKGEITELESNLKPIDEEYWKLLKAVPNMPAEDVPVGASEDENVFGELKGKKPEFDFKPKTHWEIAESSGLIDKARAAKVAGSRFAYIKGDLVKLQLALIQFVVDKLTDEEVLKKIIQDSGLENVSSNPFVPVLPPLMIRTEVYDAMDRLEPREDRYKVGSDEDDLWLQGSAEHTLGPMYMNETLDLADLPIRYLGYATSFRREAGTYGKDTEGIIRMHQFDKLEMESFVNPEGGLAEHLLFIAIQEYLMTELGIPYRVVQKCTADIGKPNARGIDLEAWLPGADGFKETHTADYMTDYQARRLNTKVKKINSGGEHDTDNMPTNFVHTNDATALALGRTMVAIIENYQNKDGSVRIPKALQGYMPGKTEI
ncbi:MAG TPA: serine--tRNA ligase [Candidatus Binatia bacterium]|nr:serine--tRNA ligase [Candidatus Binatia bacterium]